MAWAKKIFIIKYVIQEELGYAVVTYTPSHAGGRAYPNFASPHAHSHEGWWESYVPVVTEDPPSLTATPF